MWSKSWRQTLENSYSCTATATITERKGRHNSNNATTMNMHDAHKESWRTICKNNIIVKKVGIFTFEREKIKELMISKKGLWKRTSKKTYENKWWSGKETFKSRKAQKWTRFVPCYNDVYVQNVWSRHIIKEASL